MSTRLFLLTAAMPGLVPVSPQFPQVGGRRATKFLQSREACDLCPDFPQLLHFKSACADLFSSITVAADFLAAIRLASACWAATTVSGSGSAIRFVNLF